MANEEHLEILWRGVEAWNAWRGAYPEIQPDLVGVRLLHLVGADLHGARLMGADLRGAELRTTNLEGADLRGANLEGVQLWGVNLRGVNFGAANLVEAYLGEARLDRACLNDANLDSARLDRARLNGATFDRARLDGAILAGANLDRARFVWTAIGGGVDLSQTEGLEMVLHRGPSSIATSTLERTAAGLAEDASRQGAIEAFYRGVGVEDHLIEHFRSRIGPTEFYSCFISYSHDDKSFARRVHAGLQARGIRCWLDEKDLRPGDVMIDAITDAIRLTDKVLLCCSLASLRSGWVDQELAAALEIERQERKRIIIPLDLDGYLDGWEGGKAPLVRERVAADFIGWKTDNAKFETEFKRVAAALRRRKETPLAPKL